MMNSNDNVRQVPTNWVIKASSWDELYGISPLRSKKPINES